MNIDKIAGWLCVVYGGWSLLAGIVTNDMGGLTSMGYNPDMPMTFGREPLRFIFGVMLFGAIIYYGRRLLVGESTLRR